MDWKNKFTNFFILKKKLSIRDNKVFLIFFVRYNYIVALKNKNKKNRLDLGVLLKFHFSHHNKMTL